MSAIPPPALLAKLERIKILLCDVDGVLTDSRVVMGNGAEFKSFHIPDGLGLRLLMKQGVKVGWVSNRPSPATTQRAEELKIDILYQDGGSKVKAVEGILAQTGFTWEEVCYMGDDIVDMGVLKRVGLPVVPPNSIEEVLAMAAHVTAKPGGRGAVREVVEILLKAQNKWSPLVDDYSA